MKLKPTKRTEGKELASQLRSSKKKGGSVPTLLVASFGDKPVGKSSGHSSLQSEFVCGPPGAAQPQPHSLSGHSSPRVKSEVAKSLGGRKYNRPDASCASTGGPASVDSCKAWSGGSGGVALCFWVVVGFHLCLVRAFFEKLFVLLVVLCAAIYVL